MLKATGWFLLAKLVTFEEDVGLSDDLKKMNFVIRSGMEKNDDHRTKVAMEQGRIVNIGPLCWKDERKFGPNPQPWCKVGDLVTFGKFAGKIVTDRKTKEEFFLLVDEDIQVVDTEE